MKRFVSYLYSIYNNQKVNNAGFARIELRTGRNRIQIHLQDAAYAGKSGTVYLFVRKQENIQGITIGTITFHNGQADFRYEQPEENIGQTPWQIMQMSGILITIDGKVAFLSQWDEKPLDTGRFEIWDKEKEEEAAAEQEGSRQEGAESENGNSGQADQEDRSREKGGTEETGDRNKDKTEETRGGVKDRAREAEVSENGNRAGKAESRGSDTQTGRNGTDDMMAGGQEDSVTVQPGQASSIRTAEIQPSIQRKQDWEQTWRYMLRVYPVLDQFDDENNVLCVRIEIKDVRLLPDKYWSIVNNSFLLHGFFNYRYLVFGRINDNWFIGIPGVYQNQEHAMASIFGFTDFLPQSGKNERGEQPGYWYRILGIEG